MGGTKRDGGPVRVFAISVIFAALRGALRSLAGEFARHGYAILFGLVAAESFWFPLPGELSLFAGGLEASRGKLNVFWVAGAGMAAAVTGDNLAYLLGRLAGRPLIERLARLLHLCCFGDAIVPVVVVFHKRIFARTMLIQFKKNFKNY